MKQRRITQIFLTYLVGGWLVLQVVDQVVDREVLPDWAYRVALILFAFGIPTALIIGWYHGEKGDQKTTVTELALLTLLAVGAAGSSALVIRQALELESLQSGQVDLRSTAVLYFDGVGEEASAVAQGITEDLISRLDRVSQLEVASRNGSRQVQAEGLRPEAAAEILGVGSVLTGSVERFGNDYRVDVRIRDRSGTPIGGAISVEGAATNLLALQEDVAQEVEDAFRIALGDEIRLRENRAAAPNNGAWLAVARGERALQNATAAASRLDGQAAREELQQADQFFQEAIQVGDEWGHPWALRAQTAFELSYLAESMEELEESLGTAVALAEEALRRDATSPLALYIRGTARYRSQLFGLLPEEDRDAVLRAVEDDLERARTLDRNMAEVSSTLSHLYYQRGDMSSAALAAQEAYTSDAFLQSADGVLRRLFDTNYDMENARQAEQWCMEGQRRFPADHRFAECQLLLMTMAGVEPDIDRAWALRDSMVTLAPAQKDFIGAFGSVFVGGVIARAGLADSASAVLTASRMGPEVDPESELLTVEAAMRLVNGEEEEAIRLLQSYTSRNPGHFGQGRGLNWWWRSLQGNPDFERIRRLN